VLAVGVLRHVELPGLYMDGVNPEYLAARVLHPDPHNFAYLYPSATIPFLTGLYVGVQNYFFGVPFFALFGRSVTALRLFHGLIGAALVTLVFLAVRRATRTPWIAGVAALALAADPALIGSLRTQFAIVLGGTVWVVAALVVLFRPAEEGVSPSRWRELAAGALLSLSVYGYFVNGFYGPALAWIAVRERSGTRERLRAVGNFAAGVVFGLLPYVAAYASWWMASRSFRAFVASVARSVKSLEPYLPASMGERLTYVWQLTKIALTNQGNELMIFGTREDAAGVTLRLLLVAAVAAAGAIVWRWRLGTRNRAAETLLLALSYLAGAFVFGKRLWAHHLIPLLPLAYVAFGMGLSGLVAVLQRHVPGPAFAPERTGFRLRMPSLPSAAAALVCMVVLSLSIAQQQRFYPRLDAMGGSGMCSDGSTLLAEAAIRERDGTVYVFPEWGFFIPFAFLTGNQVPYEIAVDAPRVREALAAGRRVVLAHWKPSDESRYRAELERTGASRFETRPMLRRDGEPAFYLIVARAK
jgi:hypothetical protein